MTENCNHLLFSHWCLDVSWDLLKIHLRCTPKINWKGKKKTWIDWEALNRMNKFTADGLRLNIFTLEEMRHARKKKKTVMSSRKQSTILFCGNLHLWFEIYMCYLYHEDRKNPLGCIGQEYINRETVFRWTCCQCKSKNILETLKAGEL